MELNFNTILTLCSLILALLGLAWTYFGAILNIKERLVTLETKMELFWKPLQNFLTTAVHHPATPLIDEKLDRFDNLTVEELYELKGAIKFDLEELIKNKGTDNIRALYYTLLLARIDLRVHDQMVKICQTKGIIPKISRMILGR